MMELMNLFSDWEDQVEFPKGAVIFRHGEPADFLYVVLEGEIELKLADGSDVQSACRAVGVADATYYNWRRRFGGIARSQLSELRNLEKENARLKKIVAELELDKLILKESLYHLNPRA